MKHTLELILTYRGVTLGTALAGPAHVFASATGGLGADAHSEIDLVFLPFDPGPAYAQVQPVFERAWQALVNFGFLGPAADPASGIAGQDADAAARTLWDQVELRNSRGSRISGRVVVLYDQGRQSELPYWLDVSIDRSAADISALLPSPTVSVPASESAAT